MRLSIRHRTVYLYSRAVDLGPHRLMLRPRESPGLRLLSMTLDTTPPSLVRWSQDVFGNAVALARPLWAADTFCIDSHLRVETLPGPALQGDSLAPGMRSYPIRYSDADWHDLGSLAMPQHPDPQGELRRWAQGFVATPPTDMLALLRDLNGGIGDWVFYQSRDAAGTQAPLESLRRGWGSCRDLAMLLAEAARWLGFGARLVSGYIHMPELDRPGEPDLTTGSTHAWTEIYLPGAGWIAYDPTHRSVASEALVPVAVARDIAQLPPVEGSFHGEQADYVGMSVGVAVSALQPADV